MHCCRQYLYDTQHLASQITAKVLLIHGAHDERAPMLHAQKMKTALDNAGNPATLSEYTDETHGFYAEENQIRYFREVQQYMHMIRHDDITRNTDVLCVQIIKPLIDQII